MRRSERIGDPLRRVLVEVEPGRAEREIEIGDHHLPLERSGDGKRGVVANRARARAALRADKSDGLADRPRLRIAVQAGQGLDDLEHAYGSDQVLADAAAQQLAIEHDVVEVADDHDLGGGVAKPGQAVEFREHGGAVEQGFDDDEIGRGGVAIEGAGPVDAPHLHAHARAGKPPVLRRPLDRGGRVLILAKGLDVHARDGTEPRGAERLAFATRTGFAGRRRTQRKCRIADHWRAPT